MKSPKNLNYETRPCKFVERRMLSASLSSIIGRLNIDYQYIGFGGLSFTDFKLFHKELNIRTMYSIENEFPVEKLNFNKPFSFINVLNGLSTEKLSEIDLSIPSIVWLDYDDVLSMSVFQDITILFQALPHGSIYLMSCNRQLTKRDEEHNRSLPYTREELEKLFPQLVPFDLGDDCCTGVNAPETIRRMLHDYCNKELRDRNKLSSSELKFTQLYNIIYQENRGAQMYTFGGIILDKDYNEAQLVKNSNVIINSNDLFEINIPNLTRREALSIDQILDDATKEQDLIDRGIITAEDLKRYKAFYKYMPNFYDVRL